MMPFASVWNWYFWLGWFSNAGSRGHVITLCIVIVCLSLLILMGATRRS